MDIQHITNPQYSKKYFIGYNISNGLSIAIESREHFLLSKSKTKEFTSRENLIEKELQSLKDFTNVPGEIINCLNRKLNNGNEK